MRAWLSALTALLAWSAAGAAEAWTPAEVAAYCSPAGAFGRGFGETAPAPRYPHEQNTHDFTADFPPFIRRTTIFAPTAERPVAAVIADSQFRNQREARAAFAEIRRALAASGQFAAIVEPARGIVRFHTNNAGDAEGLVVTLTLNERVIMQCADAARYPAILRYGASDGSIFNR